jgi:hypothetical protein
MIKYREFNVNPKKRRTTDCTTRALVGALNIEYDEALELQCEASQKTCYGLGSKQATEYIMKKFGYVKMKQPRKANGKKYLVGEIDELLTKKQLDEGVLISMANHHTCVNKGELQDIWDCRYKTISNYYVRGD